MSQDGNKKLLLQDLSSMKNKLGTVAFRESSNRNIAAPACFHCPITHSIMRDPVIDPQGNTFDRPAIEKWLREHARTSPTSRRALTVQKLVPNRALREAIAEHMGPGWVVKKDSKPSALSRSTSAETTTKGDEKDTKPTSRSIVDGFLAELSASIGKNMRLNESGVCAFTYEILTIVIEVPLQVATFFVYTTLKEGKSVPPEGFQKNRMLELAMKKNYLQQETRGGCLGTDPNTGDLLYSFSERAHEINMIDFRNILENFIDNAMKFYKDFNGKTAVVEKAGPKTV